MVPDQEETYVRMSSNLIWVLPSQSCITKGPEPLLKKAAREIAEAMGAIPLAEGLEDEATFDALIELGYQWLQGYWHARPAAAH